jgi:hypothetical protein
VPEAFAAMFAYDQEASFEDNVEAMTDAIADVVTIEVTQAIKDAKAADGSPIVSGDTIGISGGKILSVGQSVSDVVVDMLNKLDAGDFDTCTLLAGEDLTDDAAEELEGLIEDNFEDLEIDLQRGEQPLYPVILSLE